MKKEEKKIRIIITHGDCFGEAQKLKEMIGEKFNNTEFPFINIVNNVVGAIGGPEMLALAWTEV